MKSVQNVNLHDIYGNRSVLQKQSVSHHCTSPITMHISMPHSPPYHEIRSTVPYMHHRTQSPGPQTRSPYVQHSTLSPGQQSPVWHSSAGNVQNGRMPHLLEMGLHTIILHQGEGITTDHSRHISTGLLVVIENANMTMTIFQSKNLSMTAKVMAEISGNLLMWQLKLKQLPKLGQMMKHKMIL